MLLYPSITLTISLLRLDNIGKDESWNIGLKCPDSFHQSNWSDVSVYRFGFDIHITLVAYLL